MANVFEELMEFLRITSKERKTDVEKLKQFQEKVFDLDKIIDNQEVEDLIRLLAYDLDYFEPDEEIRNEDPSFFGEAKAIELIKEAYRKIKKEFQLKEEK